MKIIIMLFLAFCFASTAFAHPPMEINVDYYQAEKMLTINFVHVSHNWNKHYIRRIEIIKGNGESQDSYYMRQNQTKDASKSISTELEANEIINVKMYCKEGGIAQASYVVPRENNQTEELSNKE
ncbi:MAG: hypothetical protein P9X22_05515 [Candidatus Zapsychrus exili]|nr:hypothetical protein [Candidatus Zapsychrus exili]